MVLLIMLLCSGNSRGAELYLTHVVDSVELGRRFLAGCQHADGAFPADHFLVHPISSTSLSTLALLKTGTPLQSPAIQNALHWLRALPPEEPARVHEIALLALVLNTVNLAADRPRVQQLKDRLLSTQLASGSWPHHQGETHGDLSATEFALIALRDLAQTGEEISVDTWQRAGDFWISSQREDGGWPEFFNEADPPDSVTESRLSGTLAGVAMLSLCESLKLPSGTAGRGNCDPPAAHSPALRNGQHWLEKHFQSTAEGLDSPENAVDHLYGLERITRPRGALFQGEERWFRRAAVSLLRRQHRSRGYWQGNNQSVSTSYALLFLSSGITPSVMNVVQMTPSTESRHPGAVWNLNEFFLNDRQLSRFHHPHELDLSAVSVNPPEPFLEGKLLFLTGNSVVDPGSPSVEILKGFVQSGGILFLSPECASSEFDDGVQRLARELTAPFPGELTRVPATHPVLSSRFPLNPSDTELWELSTGCRTVLFYSPRPIPRDWQHARSIENPGLQLGINVMTYATGSRLPTIQSPTPSIAPQPNPDEEIPGSLRLGLVQHSGGWNVAPRSLESLLRQINEQVGSLTAPLPEPVRLEESRLAQFPVLYWHGNRSFRLTAEQKRNLKQHLDRGGVLLADACCQSPEFDRPFRETMKDLFPDQPLLPVPVHHELLSERTFHDITQVRYRQPGAPAAAVSGMPAIEGIEQAGRYVVLYSRVDLSCTWESPTVSDCTLYDRTDAFRIGTNLLIYSLKQDLKEIPQR